jgi:hypothetical protein
LESFKEWLFSEEREDIHGWLGPRGKFYRCGTPFCHSYLAMRDPELRVHLTDENIELSQESGDVEVLYWDLWRAGFLRVAGYSSGIIYFEGYSDGIRNLYQKAKDLAEEYDMKAEFLNKSGGH